MLNDPALWSFNFTLATDGKSSVGEWNNIGLYPGDTIRWDSYKVCEACQYTKPVEGAKNGPR